LKGGDKYGREEEAEKEKEKRKKGRMVAKQHTIGCLNLFFLRVHVHLGPNGYFFHGQTDGCSSLNL